MILPRAPAIFITSALVFFEGCGFFGNSTKMNIRSVYPSKNSESFLAVKSGGKNYRTSIIRIDSAARIQDVAFLEPRYDRAGCILLNDSILLIHLFPRGTKDGLLFYNFIRQTLVDSVPDVPQAITGQYF